MTVDFDAHYEVEDYPGVAFYLTGYSTVEFWDEDVMETITVPNYDWVNAIMVGDDVEHLVDVDDLTKISEDDYCGSCGQIGCNHG